VADKWRSAFAGVDGCNRVLRLVEPPPPPPLTPAELVRLRFHAETRFLRGLYYFELRRTFGAVPYVDETLDPTAAAAVPNDVDIYPAIEADLQFAGDNLPETQPDPDEAGEVLPGRPNKWAAISFLGKVYLYQGKFAAAKALFDQAIANGKTAAGAKYGLSSDYAANFTGRYATPAGLNSEVVFAVETAVTPASPSGSGAAGCCGFFQPSFDLVNSFRTDPNGPPLPGTYNGSPLKNDFGIPSATPFTPDSIALDPRIDHAVGRRGVPFLNWGDHPGADWIPDQAYGGPYSPKKYVLRMARGVTRGVTTANQALMRFADVLLMAAECEVEVGSLEKARELVNQVRARAANPASWVKRPDGSNAANYVIGLYNTPWTDKDVARTAVRFERKLELSGEGHRFYDLVRWGTAAASIQSYLQFDGATLAAALGGASFTAGKNEVYPIPQEQIDARAPGVLQQNPGY
jgi:tetratricopeptide (TPR) repeat protein